MAKKPLPDMILETEIETEDIQEMFDEIVEEIDLGRSTTSDALNGKPTIPHDAYDCVIWDSNNTPIDVAVSKAYTALKTGGLFLVPKGNKDAESAIGLITALFGIGNEKIKEYAVFVKEQ